MQELDNADLITVKPVFIIQQIWVLGGIKLIFCTFYQGSLYWFKVLLCIQLTFTALSYKNYILLPLDG